LSCAARAWWSDGSRRGSSSNAANSSRTILRRLRGHPHHLVMAVEVVVQEALERVGLGAQRSGERDQRRRARTSSSEAGAAAAIRRVLSASQVDDQRVDHPPHGLVDHPALARSPETPGARRRMPGEQRHRFELRDVEQAGAQAVVDVVVVVGDLVGQIGDLRFERRLPACRKRSPSSPSGARSRASSA
jgi:hypothetical protein